MLKRRRPRIANELLLMFASVRWFECRADAVKQRKICTQLYAAAHAEDRSSRLLLGQRNVAEDAVET